MFKTSSLTIMLIVAGFLPFLVTGVPKAGAQNVQFVQKEMSPMAPRDSYSIAIAFWDIYFYSGRPDAEVKVLEKKFLQIVAGELRLNSERESWIKDYLSLVKSPGTDLTGIAPSVWAVLFSLFPELDYHQARREILFRLKQFQLEEIANSKYQPFGVDRPEDCPTFTLLNSPMAKRSLRITDQIGGTCYAHASVRATDYWNNSTGYTQETSSILSAAFGINSSRIGNKIDIDGGFPHLVAQFLGDNGGCRSTEWDSLPPAEIRKKFIQVQHIRETLIAAKKQLSRVDLLPENGDQEQIRAALMKGVDQMFIMSKATEDLTREELEIYNKAVVEFTVIATAANPNLPFKQRILAMNQFIGSLNAIQTGATDQMLTAFTDQLFRKAFCRDGMMSYRPFQILTMFDSHRREINYSQLINALNIHFKANNPQPVMMSMCTEVFNSPHLEKSKICYDQHAVLITGQKYDHKIKQCTYQILNSWGANSAGYSEYSKEANLGTVWLPREQITKSAFRLEYLGPRF